MRSLIVMVVASGMLRSGIALADEGRFADPNSVTTLPVNGVSSVGYVTVALALVLALIYGAAWLLRRVKSFNSVTKSSLNIVEAISVGPKERVVLVRVKGQEVLLGVSPGRVNVLKDLGAVEETSSQDGLANDSPQVPTFKQLLKRSMGLS